MKTPSCGLSAAIIAPLGCVLLAGCARFTWTPSPPPQSSAWHQFINGRGHANILHVEVNPVGPPHWRYVVETLQPVAISNSPPPGWEDTNWFPAWHPKGIALSKVSIEAPGCRLLDLSSNWHAIAGTGFVLESTNSDATKLTFTLESSQTNGPVKIDVLDSAGGRATAYNLCGPQ